MRLHSLVFVCSLVLTCVGFSFTLPLFTAFVYDEALFPHFFSLIIVVSLGFLGMKIFKPDKEVSLSNREGIAIVAFCWIFAGIAGTLPYISGGHLSFADAFFESVSGFTTTGASILTDIEALPKGILMWRALTHWLGGMGIIVLTLAILPLLGMGGMQLYKAEVSGPQVDKIMPRIHDTALYLWLVYFLMTLAEFILLMFAGMDWFNALAHTFATVATGGFSTQNTSITNYSAFIQWIIIFFMFIAGINFTLHFKALTTKSFKPFGKNSECKLYTLLILIGSSIISIMLWFSHNNYSIEYSIRTALFQVISITTSTGFATADYELWAPLAQGFLLYFMFMGACAGSTGGGIKVMRISLLVKSAYHELLHVLHPRVIRDIKYEGRSVSQEIITGISAFFMLYCILALLGGFFILIFGHDFATAFSAAITCLSNIGPGFGQIGPSENFAFFEDSIKYVLSFLMLLGRLEIFTLFLLFIPAFWKN